MLTSFITNMHLNIYNKASKIYSVSLTIEKRECIIFRTTLPCLVSKIKPRMSHRRRLLGWRIALVGQSMDLISGEVWTLPISILCFILQGLLDMLERIIHYAHVDFS